MPFYAQCQLLGVARPQHSFENKVVWITGGGSGLGKAYAIEFARAGANVVISGRRENQLNETVHEIEKESSQGLAIQCDVSREVEIIETVSKIVKTFGRLDVAIANAAIPITGKIEDLKYEDWKRVFEINVIGLAMTAKHALPELRKTKGRLVLVGSGGSMIASPNFCAYTSTKYAVRAIGQTLSMDLYKSGVSCTNIHPGYMNTEFAQIDNTGKVSSEKQKWDNPFTWTAEKSAKVSIGVIYKRKREYVISGSVKTFAWLGRHFPGVVHYLFTHFNIPGIEKPGKVLE